MQCVGESEVFGYIRRPPTLTYWSLGILMGCTLGTASVHFPVSQQTTFSGYLLLF